MVANARTFIVQAADAEQEDVLKAFFNALRIKFEVTGEKPYNKEFVDMVLQAGDGVRAGKGKRISSKDFDNLWK